MTAGGGPDTEGLPAAEAARRFERGRIGGRDPANAAGDGPARTTANSFWVVEGRRTCQVCRHTFRVGDMVLVEHGGGGQPPLVRHHSHQLPCSGEVVAAEPIDEDRAARFYAAVDEQNPLKQGEIAVRLRPGDPLVADLPLRARCAGCGHTLRPFEVVVLCPCDLAMPRCRLPVHHDPSRGLDCLDNWLLGKTPEHCPMSYRKLGKP
jgi:hypothetical protein